MDERVFYGVVGVLAIYKFFESVIINFFSKKSKDEKSLVEKVYSLEAEVKVLKTQYSNVEIKLTGIDEKLDMLIKREMDKGR